MKFNEFNIDEKVLQGIEKAGFEECTPVQAATLKDSLEGRDVLVQSQTGTGKTATFLITTFQLLQTREDLKDRKVLVLAPTRELAIQIEKEAKLLGSFLDLKIGCFYGGVGYNQQETLLKEGVDIVIGTPGRLMDFAKSGKINFKDFGILVIDEADRMFDMGFYPDIMQMLRKMGKVTERISLLFSATLSNKVKNLAWNHMNEPVEVNMSPEQVTVDKINQTLYHVGCHEKINLLLGIFKKYNPGNAIIFTNTKSEAVKIAAHLSGNGYDCQYLIGDLPQKKRTKVIEDVKSGKIKFLVATDVAARGIHIDDLNLVINYDIPEDFENYVHRIGRTARAGKTGHAITLACEKYVYGLEGIESYIRMKIPVEWAGDELFSEDESSSQFVSDFMKKSPIKPLQKGRRDKPGSRKGKRQESDRKRTGSRKASQQTEPRKHKGKKADIERNKAGKHAKKRVEAKLPKNATPEERMKFYAEKYGESFEVSRETKSLKHGTSTKMHGKKGHKKSKVQKKKGFLSKVFGIFKK